MALPIYQVDAFSSEVFRGNPAAVMPLEHWPDDDVLQSMAMENNLSETAFMVREGNSYALRWFTPEVEVDLCGHATLAAAHVLFEHLGQAGDSVKFTTHKAVELTVARSEAGLTLDFPRSQMQAQTVDVNVCDALGAVASEAYAPVSGAGPLLCVYEFESDIAALQPDFRALVAAAPQPVIVTAPGEDCDAVSRFFAPHVGLDEDPVTGSAHCSIVPYWAARLGCSKVHCRQISARGGELFCELRGERVLMTGRAVTYMSGTVSIAL